MCDTRWSDAGFKTLVIQSIHAFVLIDAFDIDPSPGNLEGQYFLRIYRFESVSLDLIPELVELCAPVFLDPA